MWCRTSDTLQRAWSEGATSFDILGEYNAPFSDLLGESKGGKSVHNYTVLEALEMYSQKVYIYNNLELNYRASGQSYQMYSTVLPRNDMNTQEDSELRRANTGIFLFGEYWNPVMFSFVLSAMFSVVAVAFALLLKKKVARPQETQMPRESE